MNYYQNFSRYGEKPAAVQEDGVTLTYQQLDEVSGKITESISERSLVFCFCSNTIGSMCGYLGFLSHRIVPLMLDAQINQSLAAELLERYEPQYLYVPKQLTDEYAQYEVVYEGYDYCLLKTEYTDKPEMNDELALLLTTSGSTGSPKLVRQSYGNIQANAEAIAEYLALDETERPITTLPMNYTYGLSIINSHILVGATILLTTQPIITKPFWDFMKDQRATSFGGVPYTYEMLKKVRFFKMKLPDLRAFTQAGGKLSPELHKEFAEYAKEQGKHFVVMYGQTEATARMAYLPYERSLEKYGSMGIAIPGGKFSLLDVADQEIAEPEVVGELVYEGPNVTLGYAVQREDLAKGDERQGILKTGDMAKRDADGFYYIVGRKKRFLKLFGNRVNLDEIDGMIKREFEDLDCASTGTDDEMRVYITDEAYVKKVEELLTDKTHLNARIFRILVVDQIPRNEAGKVLYKNLED